ncbi:RDD family protein [Mycobacterium sp. 94-17]|uniref:RDD family protein n=1 Tax=Mycobacterium sp. 94-17 TaxID=2986147 RepID=UPI002D1EF3E8|nr:RDD family protein [Mycobacterium sp. 94-17]MEB4209062.1 RDD family protein [Mycobacterium sp. 94-17]
MTVVVEQTAPTASRVSSREALAPWHSRVGAVVVDVLPGIAVIITMALVLGTVPTHGVWWWLAISVLGIVILVVLANRLLLPVITGWSLGRAMAGIAVTQRTGASPGPWTLLLRDVVHLLDTASIVGWLWPLWDSRRRTFADMLTRTEVRGLAPDQMPAHIRRWSAVAVSSAGALCLAGAAVSYFAVYSADRATDQTRAQIATQGPKMVAQMLTYDPASLHDDFARALSLATDKYRSQLAAQQDLVQKAHPIINEYWVTNSSIESAAPDRATMLLFMQGRRGTGPEQRYISATVRVNFAKSAGNAWRVDDLNVLTKPTQPGSGR